MKHGGIDYHGALAPLEEACSLADADLFYVSDLMRTGSIKNSMLRKIGIALRHIQLVWTLFINRKRQGILVRDFSNIPLACVFPFLFWRKDKMWFVVNHNLQWTLGSRAERAAFRRLGRWGCRFVFFEQVPVDLLTEYGIDPSYSLAIPHPVPETLFKHESRGRVEMIGIIGQFREEKGVDELLEKLVPLASEYRIRLAFPNLESFRRLSRFGKDDLFELVDTGSFENYLKAIAECDVVLLNHPIGGYEYRASGLIADAAAAHVPIVVRNLSVLRSQASNPACIGECFDDLSDIPACIERVSGRLAKGEYDFSIYNRDRDAQALAQQLDQICNATPTI